MGEQPAAAATRCQGGESPCKPAPLDWASRAPQLSYPPRPNVTLCLHHRTFRSAHLETNSPNRVALRGQVRPRAAVMGSCRSWGPRRDQDPDSWSSVQSSSRSSSEDANDHQHSPTKTTSRFLQEDFFVTFKKPKVHAILEPPGCRLECPEDAALVSAEALGFPPRGWPLSPSWSTPWLLPLPRAAWPPGLPSLHP